jgi:hypothetical protein
MRMNRRFDSVASLREGVALNSARAVPEQIREPRIQLLVGHLPHVDLGFQCEIVRRSSWVSSCSHATSAQPVPWASSEDFARSAERATSSISSASASAWSSLARVLLKELKMRGFFAPRVARVKRCGSRHLGGRSLGSVALHPGSAFCVLRPNFFGRANLTYW